MLFDVDFFFPAGMLVRTADHNDNDDDEDDETTYKIVCQM